MAKLKRAYTVDGNEFPATERIITPNEIFKIAYPNRNPYSYYLTVVCNFTGQARSLKGKMASPIVLDHEMKFITERF